ncbi:low molecular weight protein arginine phosphatase [Clostridium cochlearium]|uniref:Low molecular weight protein arginine phosphatase n=1 Tax=Clostridium cochlearium TaxID=1494 RepID=A0A7Y4DEE5_CLOCO|nr:low molecular weight protein arginine phosphatase [Clostridium cochlearium]NOH16742.1 low molecular weight protein arginine phosphatase [Clostridium cochlearium]
MNILFVCTGNTCRSPMAEAIFNKFNTTSLIAKSAGVAVYPNSKASSNAAKLVDKNLNINIYEREAIQLTEQMLKNSYLVLTMTEGLKKVLKHNFQEYEEKIYTLNEYVGVKGEILDPFGGTLPVYQQAFIQLKENILLLLSKLGEDKVFIKEY